MLNTDNPINLKSGDTTTPQSRNEDWVVDLISPILRNNPSLAEVFHRLLREELIRAGCITMEELERRSGIASQIRNFHPNELRELPWTNEQRAQVNLQTRLVASQHLTRSLVEGILGDAITAANENSLISYVGSEEVTLAGLRERLQEFCSRSGFEARMPLPDLVATRVRLARLLLSDVPQYIEAAKQYIGIGDYLEIIDKVIGSEQRIGRVGGKAAGLFLAYMIVKAVKEQPGMSGEFELEIPESRFITHEVFDEVVKFNSLNDYRNRKYWKLDKLHHEYPAAVATFRNIRFPPEIDRQLRQYLENVGESMIIVRSSSLLEDRSGAPFSGKYASLVVDLTGPMEERMAKLSAAIGEVYASVWHPDPIQYRRDLKLLDHEESMGILLQRVIGERRGRYFTADFAGVANSHNDYIWSERMKRENGMVRLVAGLGMGAVDRQGDDYARLAALSDPTIRPEGSVREIMRASQRKLYVIDTQNGELIRVPFHDFVAQTEYYSALRYIASTYSRDNDMLRTGFQPSSHAASVVTFDGLLGNSTFPSQMRSILWQLESALGEPVDIEFCGQQKKLYLLQCRPQMTYKQISAVKLPEDLSGDEIVFNVNHMVPTVDLEGLKYLVYVHPEGYSKLDKVSIMKVVSALRELNSKLERRSFILVGPGRWGTGWDDPWLGVPLRFSELNNCALLCEIADPQAGRFSEPSLGTHFFNDLVGHDIRVLALYPRKKEAIFNRRLLDDSPSALASFISNGNAEGGFNIADVLRVIDIPAVTQGKRLHIKCSGPSQLGFAYIQ